MAGDWDELFSEKHKRKYWKNSKTGQTSWTAPAAGLADDTAAEEAAVDDWDELFNEKHQRKYWKNKKTGKTSWVAPTGAALEDVAKVVPEDKETDGSGGKVVTETTSSSSEWVEAYSEKHKRKYWKHMVTGKTSWTPPEAEAKRESKPTSAPAPASGKNDEWEELYSEKHKRKYWKHKTSGKTQWTPPPPPATESMVPASEWEELFSEKHKKKYWKNKTTGKTSWTAPEESVTPTPGTDAGSAEAKAEDWVEGYSEKHKRKFWKSTSTGKTSWTPPASQPKVEMPPAPLGTTPTAAPLIAAIAIVPPAAPTMQTVVKKMLFLVGSGGNEATKPLTISVVEIAQVDAASVLISVKDVTNVPAMVDAIQRRQWTQLSDDIMRVRREFQSTTVQVRFSRVAARLGLASRTEANAVPNSAEVSFHSALLLRRVVEVIKAMMKCSSPVPKDLESRVMDTAEPALQAAPAAAVRDAIEVHNVLRDLASCEAALALQASSEIVRSCDAALVPKLAEAQRDVEALLRTHEQELQRSGRKSPISAGLYDSADPNMIPLSGIHVIQVSPAQEGVDGLPPSCVAPSSQWTPCWLQLDVSKCTIGFHEHGPSQPASFYVNCQRASLLLPDLTDFATDTVISIKQGTLSDTNTGLDVAFQFKTVEELWRTALSLATICCAVTGKYCDSGARRGSAAAVSEFHTAMRKPLARDGAYADPSQPLSFLTLPSFSHDLVLSLESMLADRLLCAECIRYLHLTGPQLRSLKFQQIQQRIVVVSKGVCPNVIEGSVLLSINGLSALQVAAGTVMKFISELPKQMNADMVLIKFPRAEFAVDVLDIQLGGSGGGGVAGGGPDGTGGESSVVVNKHNSSHKKLDAESTQLLHRAIAKKRFSIVTVPAADGGVKAAGEMPTDLAQGHQPMPRQTVSLESYLSAEAPAWKWSKHTCTIANGKVVISAPDSPLDQGVRIPITTMQLQVLFPKAGRSLRDLSILLSDGQAVRVLLRPPSPHVFQCIVRRLVIAMKLHNVLSVDLAWIYHQSEGWRKNKQQLTDVSRKYSTLVKSSSTLSTILNSIQTVNSDDASLAAAQTPVRSTTVLQAAEALDVLLSGLGLPPSFPGPEVVENVVGDVLRLTKSNHQMLADLMVAQYEAVRPLDAASSAAPTSITKAMHAIFPEATMAPEDSGLGDNLLDDMEDSHESTLTSGALLLDEEDEHKKDSKRNRRHSRLSILNDINHNTAMAAAPTAPAPPASVTNTQGLVNLNTASAVASAGAGPGAGVGSGLTAEELTALSVVFSHFRERPEDFSQLAAKARMGHDLKALAFVTINRLFHPCSCDQFHLGRLILTLLAPATGADGAAPKGLSTGLHGMRLAGGLNQMDKTALLSSILQELSQRADTVAFVGQLCEDMALASSLTVDSDISDLCVLVVEPICAKLEQLLQTGGIPAALRFTVLALQEGSKGGDSLSHHNIKKFLAQCVTSFVPTFLANANKKNMEGGAAFLTDPHCGVVAERVKDLFSLCFDQDLSRRMQLCLSDTAALSRSKWLVSRCIDFILQTETAISAVPMSEAPSPVAVLASLHPVSGRAQAMDGVLCLRPSELLFMLRLLDIGSITTSSFLSSTRHLTAAVSVLHNSDIMSRLGKFSVSQNTGGMLFSVAAKGLYAPSALDRDVVYTIAVRAADAGEDQKLFVNLWSDGSGSGGASKGLLSDSDTVEELADGLFANSAQESRDAGSNVLSSIVWLVNVAKSTLKRVYEDPTVVAKGEATVRELTELRQGLLTKQDLIRKAIKDWERLLQCKELCNDFKAQLALLGEMFKGRRKAEHWRAGGFGVGVVDDSFRYPLLLSTIKEIVGEPSAIARNLGWSELDEERERSLARLLGSCRAADEKLQEPYKPANAVVAPVNRFSISTNSRLSFGLPSGVGRVGREEAIFPPTPTKSGLPTTPALQGMNPLWAIMQNVFRHPT